ncbi:hypothetical protein G6F66_014892 [Rhizopus arrhizus]|nr:hypothetical protein G6F66_014892 [Rhizopus arrhizus]
MPHAGYGTAPVPFPPAAPPRAGRGCSAAPARSPAAGAAPRTPRARPASPTPHRPRLLQHCRTAPAPAPRGAGSAAPCSRSLPARWSWWRPPGRAAASASWACLRGSGFGRRAAREQAAHQQVEQRHE